LLGIEPHHRFHGSTAAHDAASDGHGFRLHHGPLRGDDAPNERDDEIGDDQSRSADGALLPERDAAVVVIVVGIALALFLSGFFSLAIFFGLALFSFGLLIGDEKVLAALALGFLPCLLFFLSLPRRGGILFFLGRNAQLFGLLLGYGFSLNTVVAGRRFA